MLSTGNDTDPEEDHAISPTGRLENDRRSSGFIASNWLSLLKTRKALARWRNIRNHSRLIDGRTRSTSRARDPSFNDRQSRRRCGGISLTAGAADGSSAGLLPPPLCTD